MEMFYCNQKALYSGGHELVIALTPNEVVPGNSCETECGENYIKADCYADPNDPDNTDSSSGSNDMCN